MKYPSLIRACSEELQVGYNEKIKSTCFLVPLNREILTSLLINYTLEYAIRDVLSSGVRVGHGWATAQRAGYKGALAH